MATHDAGAERSVALTAEENIRSTHRRLYGLLECSLLHTEDLTQCLSSLTNASSDALEAEAGSADVLENDMGDLHSLFLERHTDSSDLPFSPLPEHVSSLTMLYRTLGTAERITFCRTLSQQPHMPKSTQALLEQLFGETEPVDHEAAGKVAYQRNIFADEAYLHVSPYIRNPRAVYAGSFAGVCEQVYNGLCEYCILPLENSQDGKLLRFYGLIQKYELKIALTCDVTSSDKRHVTTFALCKRSLQSPLSLVYGVNRSVCFEFIFRQDSDDYPRLYDLLAAAQACSLRLLRVDCLPRSDDEIMVGAGYPFNISLDVENGDLRSFLLFLALDAPICLPLGIYHHL